LSEDPSPSQSAALPYRVRDGRVEVLLVTPRGGEGWILPKGKIEARLGPAKSARREAMEEGGVRGTIDPAPLDRYRHGGRDDGPLVAVYLLRVTREMASWPESHQRARRWADPGELGSLVVDPGLGRVLRDAAAHLAARTGDEADGRRHRLVGPALVLAVGSVLAALAFLAG
jgi:8-oxo-dGTP pyrophosphatase MutT (NUDIX family)